MQDWNLADQIAGLENAGLEFDGPNSIIAGLENAGLENAGPENAGLESDELRLKQPQSTDKCNYRC